VKAICRDWGLVDYATAWQAMREFTDRRAAQSSDELWLLEHPAVFTLGRAGRREHVLAAGDIPVVASDRGGQVTYHGPGQLVVYVLADVERLGIGPRELVRRLEQAVIDYCAVLQLTAERRPGAPGVYVEGAKLAALGLRLRRGCSYHGLALNVDLDLEPFSRINPCGYAGMRVCRLCDLRPGLTLREVRAAFASHVLEALYGAGSARVEWHMSGAIRAVG
jgi:lipoyl(octanoyl) transferase